MYRTRLLKGLICLGLVFCSAAVFMADGYAKGKGRGKGRDRVNDGSVPPVEWAADIAGAAADARTDDCPYLIFFCSQEVAEFAGTGSKAVEKYSKTVTRMPAVTAFEAAAVMDTLDAVEYPIAKVVLTPQTVEIARKYRIASTPSLVACEPQGTVLCGLYGQVTEANTIQFLKSLKEVYANWKKANANKAPAPVATGSEP